MVRSEGLVLVATLLCCWACAAIPVPFPTDAIDSDFGVKATVGFHSELKANFTLSPNSTTYLGKLTSLKKGVFGFQSSLDILSGTFKISRSGVYYLSTIIHLTANSSQSCPIKVAICISNDCVLNASLQGMGTLTEEQSTLMASGLLLLETQQTVRVHISNYGAGEVVVSPPSSFSAYLLWAI